MLTCKQERLSEILPEVEELWKEHWAETEKYRAGLGYSPDKEVYLAYDRQGSFRLYTLRDDAGRLVGQVGFIVYTSRHTQTKVAGEDFIYVRPEARGRGAATQLLRFGLLDLRDEGVSQVTASEKFDDDAKRLFEKVGMKQVARQYSLVFKEV